MVTSDRRPENVYRIVHYKLLQTLRNSGYGLEETSLHLNIDRDACVVMGSGNNFSMKMGLKIVSIALLCLAGTESVFAGPFSRGHEGRQEFHAVRQRRPAPQEEQPQQQAEGRRVAPVAPSAAPGNSPFSGRVPETGQEGNGASQPQPGARMRGHMTIEERRALRRQINDAGHDIYAPRK